MELPKEKQTSLGLYVTSKEAYEMCRDSPDKIKILDVRTPEEYLFVGHAEMAWNIPAFIQRYEWDAEKQKFPMELNPSFLSDVKGVFSPEDQILVTCRSGGRSAMAIQFLAKAGFKNLYNIVDGFEGDTIQDPESVFHGQHMRNGWKNSGLPYTYAPTPERMIIPGTKNSL
jgi:rhodanese-related sulfurtransferase